MMYNDRNIGSIKPSNDFDWRSGCSVPEVKNNTHFFMCLRRMLFTTVYI
jgi:hypothetical protein